MAFVTLAVLSTLRMRRRMSLTLGIYLSKIQDRLSGKGRFEVVDRLGQVGRQLI
jgi:hypothetical protein